MNICSNRHEKIVYAGSICPLCQAEQDRADLETENNLKTSEIEDLVLKVEQLEARL